MTLTRNFVLNHTFCHIPRVTPKAEELLWQTGLCCWQDARTAADYPAVRISRDTLLRELDESAVRLEQGDARYFADGLPSHLQWRLFPEFRDRIAYLDIETTGLSPFADAVTSIALYDGREIRYYIQGQNFGQFARDVREYGVLVTYNGKCFDLPFLRASLNLTFDQAHIDLRYVLHRLGYSGGLKQCEKKLGIDRDELDNVDGFMAVQFWREYQDHHDLRALETLLCYNIQDVLNLETLLVMAYNLELRTTPFLEARTLLLPVLPENPFRPDVELIRRLQGRAWWPGAERRTA